MAEVLRGRLRRTDVVGRVGGEEFGAILPGASIDEVAIVAEKIRHAVEELRTPIAGSGELVQVTVSAGGASLDGREINVDRLMGCADQALYEAKRRGRNQIMLWTEDSLLPDTLRATHYTVKDED